MKITKEQPQGGNMNQELDLYIELQGRLNEFRGEWRTGDMIYCQSTEQFDVYTYDRGDCKECIWLPLPIDPQDPERVARGEKPRGLWGMVDWGRYKYEQSDDEGNMLIYKLPYIGLGHRKDDPIIIDTPTHALLLALRAQWAKE